MLFALQAYKIKAHAPIFTDDEYEGRGNEANSQETGREYHKSRTADAVDRIVRVQEWVVDNESRKWSQSFSLVVDDFEFAREYEAGMAYPARMNHEEK